MTVSAASDARRVDLSDTFSPSVDGLIVGQPQVVI